MYNSNLQKQLKNSPKWPKGNSTFSFLLLYTSWPSSLLCNCSNFSFNFSFASLFIVLLFLSYCLYTPQNAYIACKSLRLSFYIDYNFFLIVYDSLSETMSKFKLSNLKQLKPSFFKWFGKLHLSHSNLLATLDSKHLTG